MDLAKKFVRITDSMDNFHGFADPADAVDYGFLQFLGPDFRFWLLYCSDRGFILPYQSGFSIANMTFFRRRNIFGVKKIVRE